jgi:hypothetical protein
MLIIPVNNQRIPSGHHTLNKFFENLPTKQRRWLQTLLGSALVLGILGFSNTFYGYRKYQQYSAHYRQASAATPLAVPFLSPDETRERNSEQLEKMKASVEFYAFVTLGGKYFLAGSGLLLLVSLLLMRQR